MKFKYIITVFLSVLLILSCGIEENIYLPQVPQNRIQRTSNTEATINLPAINSYYAQNYLIYYKIYISGEAFSSDIQTSSERNSINPDLERDYRNINSYADPVSQTSVNVESVFASRGYFELEFYDANAGSILPISGGTVKILFPTGAGEYPTISYNNGSRIMLRRSSELISPEPAGDPYFRNTNELSDPAKANSNINADVSSNNVFTQYFAYTSMYIVAVGLDTASFKPIYSKPTYISIFRLPNIN